MDKIERRKKKKKRPENKTTKKKLEADLDNKGNFFFLVFLFSLFFFCFFKDSRILEDTYTHTFSPSHKNNSATKLSCSAKVCVCVYVAAARKPPNDKKEK